MSMHLRPLHNFDLMLPRSAGEDVYMEMRATPETRMIPVVIVTGKEVRHLEARRRQA